MDVGLDEAPRAATDRQTDAYTRTTLIHETD